MGRARGADELLAIKKETTYGTQATGDFYTMSFNSNGLSSEQNLITDPVLGQGREPLAPQQDVINVDGAIRVPVDLRRLGHWLTGLLGAPVSSDETDHWQHVWESGKSTLPSYSVEAGSPAVPSFRMQLGVVVDAMEFNFERNGFASVNVDLIGQGENKPTATSQAGTPVELDYRPFSQFQGAVKKDGVLFANLESASIRYSNNLDRVETIRDDGKIDGVDPTIVGLSGNIAMRFATNELFEDAFDGTPMELEFSYKINDDQMLVITVHQVHIPKPKISVDGPGGITSNYAWQGALNSAAGKSMTVKLLNDVDDTVY